MAPDFDRKHIRLKHFAYKSGFAYFLTICTFDRKPLFRGNNLANLVESAIDFYIIRNIVNVYCYCIMPDHIHLLLTLNENYDKDLSSWVSSLKRFISREAGKKFGISNIWQRNYYDHIVRTDESLFNIAEYILNNPVRKGMAGEWSEYPFSKIKFKQEVT